MCDDKSYFTLNTAELLPNMYDNHQFVQDLKVTWILIKVIWIVIKVPWIEFSELLGLAYMHIESVEIGHRIRTKRKAISSVFDGQFHES